MKEIKMNLPNDGYDLCECGYVYIDGVCSNVNCPIKNVYDNGYKVYPKNKNYPVIEI